jgi:hypothetical protein
MPVILAAQEAEIRRIVVQSQPRQIVHETLSQKYSSQNRAGGVAQVVEHLLRKHEALSAKGKKKQQGITQFLKLVYFKCIDIIGTLKTIA